MPQAFKHIVSIACVPHFLKRITVSPLLLSAVVESNHQMRLLRDHRFLLSLNWEDSTKNRILSENKVIIKILGHVRFETFYELYSEVFLPETSVSLSARHHELDTLTSQVIISKHFFRYLPLRLSAPSFSPTAGLIATYNPFGNFLPNLQIVRFLNRNARRPKKVNYLHFRILCDDRWWSWTILVDFGQ